MRKRASVVGGVSLPPYLVSIPTCARTPVTEMSPEYRKGALRFCFRPTAYTHHPRDEEMIKRDGLERRNATPPGRAHYRRVNKPQCYFVSESPERCVGGAVVHCHIIPHFLSKHEQHYHVNNNSPILERQECSLFSFKSPRVTLQFFCHYALAEPHSIYVTPG